MEPEKLTQLFIEITDDLSYARTHYNNRSVRAYLNQLAQSVYFYIYKNRIRHWQKLTTFWKEELPMVLFNSRRELLFSAILFMVAMTIGIVSSIHDPDFSRFILGDRYVQMTEENIASGDPLKVYKEMAQGEMFVAITLNNLEVAFMTFLLGITLAGGTAVYILFNGVMVGTFQYFFIERGLFLESFLTIWVHGTLEIAAIIIAGAAGFALGRSLLFPGTYSRVVAFRKGALNAFKIFLGITPLIVAAGILESFFTRYTDVPDVFRALIILAELSFVVVYYVLQPARKAARGFTFQERPDELYYTDAGEVSTAGIKKDGQLFAESFRLLARHIRTFAPWALLLALVSFSMYVYALGWSGLTTSDLVFRELIGLLHFRRYPSMIIVHILAMGILIAMSVHKTVYLDVSEKATGNATFFMRTLPVAFLGAIALLLPFYLGSILAGIGALLLFPPVIYLLTSFAARKEQRTGFFGCIRLLGVQFSNILLMLLALLLISTILLNVLDLGITYLLLELLKWNIPFDAALLNNINDSVLTIILLFLCYLQIPLYTFAMSLFYFNSREIVYASSLQQKIRDVLG